MVYCLARRRHRSANRLLAILASVHRNSIARSSHSILIAHLNGLPRPNRITIRLFPIGQRTSGLGSVHLGRVVLRPRRFRTRATNPTGLISQLGGGVLTPRQLVLGRNTTIVTLHGSASHRCIGNSLNAIHNFTRRGGNN